MLKTIIKFTYER